MGEVVKEGIFNCGVLNGYSNFAEKAEMEEILNRVQITSKSMVDNIHEILQVINGNYNRKSFVDNINTIKNEVEKLVSIVNGAMRGIAKTHVFIYIIVYCFQECRQDSINFLACARKLIAVDGSSDVKTNIAEFNSAASVVNLSTSLLLSSAKELLSIPTSVLQITSNQQNYENWDEVILENIEILRVEMERIQAGFKAKTEAKKFSINSVVLMKRVFLLCGCLSLAPHVNSDILSRRYVELHHCSAVILSNISKIMASPSTPHTNEENSVNLAFNSIYSLLKIISSEVKRMKSSQGTTTTTAPTATTTAIPSNSNNNAPPPVAPPTISITPAPQPSNTTQNTTPLNQNKSTPPAIIINNNNNTPNPTTTVFTNNSNSSNINSNNINTTMTSTSVNNSNNTATTPTNNNIIASQSSQTKLINNKPTANNNNPNNNSAMSAPKDETKRIENVKRFPNRPIRPAPTPPSTDETPKIVNQSTSDIIIRDEPLDIPSISITTPDINVTDSPSNNSSSSSNMSIESMEGVITEVFGMFDWFSANWATENPASKLHSYTSLNQLLFPPENVQ